MRSLPSILGSNPDVQVVIVGGDGISYGQPAPKGFSNYREALTAEIRHRIDETRIHFTGKVPTTRTGKSYRFLVFTCT